MSPTKAENGNFHIMQETQESHANLIDDLPTCLYSAVGCSTNQVYRTGTTKEQHEFEDRSFHLSLDENTYLYGVFDGEFGTKAVNYASQKIPAEIILDSQLHQKSEEEIVNLLHQTFRIVERTFFQSIDELLAEKESIKEGLANLPQYEAWQNHPTAVRRLSSINAEMESGASAVVALIYKNKLYVANVGNCRALLVTSNEENDILVQQLNVSHDFENDDELLRLSQLGLDTKKLRNESSNFRHLCTRCIGNYAIKGGYKEYENLSKAIKEPVIAEPEIVGGISIDNSFKFLLLMSDGLYKSLEQATGTSDVNTMIVQFTFEQFPKQTTLTGVAQGVVDKATRLHHDSFIQNNEFSKSCQKRDDITLLVRNFNQTLATSATNGYNTSRNSSECKDEGSIDPYVDFTDFYKAVAEAYENGEVPKDWLREE